MDNAQNTLLLSVPNSALHYGTSRKLTYRPGRKYIPMLITFPVHRVKSLLTEISADVIAPKKRFTAYCTSFSMDAERMILKDSHNPDVWLLFPARGVLFGTRPGASPQWINLFTV